ncbi:MAG: serine/threonine-protein kinase [Chthoniobacter sp.]|nr:serine/threonine-protein kinase [Chthoniobacter sp.]
MAGELTGKELGGWSLHKYINCGKSALVFQGEKNGHIGAVKIFDPEIIETYGDQKQLERIDREKSLIGRPHANLIEILDGGMASIDGVPFYYVVMEFFPGKNLADRLRDIRPEDIWSIISQVASAAEFLESLGLCHRDIKPENIGIDDDGRVVKLLDLGVVRPVKASDLTDTSVLPFIGTLRYAPPEFLLRTEDHTTDGWRALTFYQIGGVLHDLIMRTPLFQEFSQPFARLVNAVQHEKPKISSSQVPADLIVLAKSCLAKKPETRLQIVSWNDFHPPQAATDPLQAVKARLSKRREEAALTDETPVRPSDDKSEATWKLRDYSHQVRSMVRSECVGSNFFPRLTVGDVTLTDGKLARFQIVFEPSPDLHNLDVYLAFFVETSWLDSDDDIVCVKIHAVAARTTPAPGIPHPDGSAIYQGTFNQEKISAALSPFLYAALDAIQRHSESGESGETWMGGADYFAFGMDLLPHCR